MKMLATALALVSLASITTAQSCPAGSLPANQVIRWTPCPVSSRAYEAQGYYAPTAECGTIDVPLDYTDASSEGLTLALVRIPATSPNPLNKTIIYNPGGPGVSGVESLLQGGEIYTTLTGGDYNVLSFDPRGVGLTIPYQCPSADVYVAGYGLPLDTDEALNATYEVTAAQGEICATSPYLEQGELLGTAFVARDVDAIAQALDEGGLIRYWGASYGTLLGSTIAAMFPEKIDRMVLDGNINPTDYYHGPGDEAVDDVDREVSYFFETCAAAGPATSEVLGCAWSDGTSTGPELEAVFFDFLNGLKNGTISTVDTQNDFVTYNSVKGEMYADLKRAGNFPLIASRLEYYWRAQTSNIGLSKRQVPDVDITAALGEYQPQALYAITCGEWDEIPAGDLNDFKELLALYNQRSAFGDQLVELYFSCATWNITARERFEGEFSDIQTKMPILFVNSDMDPVTPLISAQNSSTGFVGSAVLQHRGAGHCSNAHPSNCVQEKILAYWQTGQIPDVNEICQPNVQPFKGDVEEPFNVSRPVGNATRDLGYAGQDEFNKAVAGLAKINYQASWRSKRSLPDFFPVELLNKRTSSPSRAIHARQADASCTPVTAVAAAPRPSESSSSSENSARRVAVSLSLVAAVVGLVVL